MKFRNATKQDIQQIMYIIEQAKKSLKKQGINQWQNGYPNKETILEDIKHNESYVIEDNFKVIATCMITNQQDPTYAHIEDGQWLQEKEYAVIHRVAIHPSYKGKNIASLLIKNALTMYPNVYSIRADTHKNNLSMQRLLEKNNFQYCGIIYISDGTKRKAYEKNITS